MNDFGSSTNCVDSSFVTTGVGELLEVDAEGEVCRTLAIDHVRPGMARSVAYSVNGGRWFTPPLPYAVTVPYGACCASG